MCALTPEKYSTWVFVRTATHCITLQIKPPQNLHWKGFIH